MSSYDNPLVITYSWPEHDFGAGAGAHGIQSPAGLDSCRIIEIHVAVTETFTADTLAGFVRLGTAADPNRYAELQLDTTSLITNGVGLRSDSTALVNTAGYDAGIIHMAQEGITQIEVVFDSPTGGTPAGKGIVSIALGWW